MQDSLESPAGYKFRDEMEPLFFVQDTDEAEHIRMAQSPHDGHFLQEVVLRLFVHPVELLKDVDLIGLPVCHPKHSAEEARAEEVTLDEIRGSKDLLLLDAPSATRLHPE